jgi:transcriptional regulator with XRE-family HTH domain
MRRKVYKEYFKKLEQSESYSYADALYAFIEDLHMATVEQKISYSHLADKIGNSPTYITRVMRGDYNLTIDTMVKLARAVDLKLKLGLERPAFESSISFGIAKPQKMENVIAFPEKKSRIAEVRQPESKYGLDAKEAENVG